MTGPDGDQPHGYWRVLAVDAPRRLEVEDGFADDTGAPNPDLPVTTMRVDARRRAPAAARRCRSRSTFPSAEAMDQMIAMGMEEGMTEAMGQIDGAARGRDPDGAQRRRGIAAPVPSPG